VVTSVYPAALRPEVAVDVLRGDLGLDDGRGQSIFEVPRAQLTSGAVHRVARQNLFVGEQLRLDDGTTVRFDGVVPWVGLQVSHDPAEHLVLLFAVLVLLGLGISLTVKRRRFWARIRPAGPLNEAGDAAAATRPAASATAADPPGRPVQRLDQRGRTVLEIGGLARTDQAGYGEEFTRLRTALLGEPAGTATEDGNQMRPNVPESGEARPDAGQRDAGHL
jgi:cytochrome c biogenesis protein